MSIEFENVVLPSAEQWRAVILGARNAMNSWDRYDSGQGCSVDFVDRMCSECDRFDNEYEYGFCVGRVKKFIIGPNDMDLMRRLAACGPVHAKYRRMIAVILTITAPLYWWKEADTYRIGVEKNSCSTMHKIHAKRFDRDDFSHEHLMDGGIYILNSTIDMLNEYRSQYLETKDKKYWWQMIQLLPSSYNQKRTVMLNYEVLAGIYPMRKDHKLDEWHDFCDWIKALPYSELITGENKNVS